MPQTVPEKKIEYVPVETVTERIEYFPVEKQVVHYPDEAMTHSRRNVVNVVPTQMVTTSTVPVGHHVSRPTSMYGNMATTTASYSPMGTFTTSVQPMNEMVTTTINVSEPISMNGSTPQYVVGGVSGQQQSTTTGYTINERSISSGTGQTVQSSRPKSSLGTENYSYQAFQPSTQNDYQKFSSEGGSTAIGQGYPKSRIGAGQAFST